MLFATPGMLTAGLALEAFKVWAGDPRNMVLVPGYCVQGTLGAKVQSGAKQVEVEGRSMPVRCKVCQASFSAHADAKGILQLIRTAQPRCVLLVHGEPVTMAQLKRRIERDYGLPCLAPPNLRLGLGLGLGLGLTLTLT